MFKYTCVVELIMAYEVLKGTSDTIPSEKIKVNFVLDTVRKNFESYGFRPFDTPTIEYFDTLAMKYDKDAEIVQEIFSLTDRGSRELGLRYDLTTPLSRFVAMNIKSLKKPFRRYQIGNVFRDGPIKPGRLREFIQADGDVVGIEGIEIEAELLRMFFDTYTQLGINSVIEINNNKILRGSLLQNGFKEKDLSSIILSIDKLKKIGREEVLKEILDKGFEIKKAEKALDILNCNSFEEIEKLANNSLLNEGVLELKKLTELISSKVNFRINFSMSRGLDIYTGNIWEAYDNSSRITSSIGSGGRYDRVIGEYAGVDENIPAVGVSFGIVPILAAIGDKLQNKESLTDILVVPLDSNLVLDCFTIAEKLRVEGFNVEVFYGYKLKKAFDYADYLGCKKIVIYGSKDKENKEYVLKNLSDGKEKKVKLK